MLPHISFSEIVETLFLTFMVGMVAGLYLAIRIDDTIFKRKKK